MCVILFSYILCCYFYILLIFLFLSTPLSLYNPSPPPFVPSVYCSLVSVVVIMSVTFKQFKSLFSCPSEKQNETNRNTQVVKIECAIK